MLSVFYNAPKITSGALSDGDNRDGDMLMLNINRSLSRSAFSPFCRTWLMEKKKELGVKSDIAHDRAKPLGIELRGSYVFPSAIHTGCRAASELPMYVDLWVLAL
jgi:hypothetical protein